MILESWIDQISDTEEVLEFANLSSLARQLIVAYPSKR